MTDKERYEALRRRADAVNNEIASLEGERAVFIKKLKEKGFNNITEVKEYIEQKRVERVKQEAYIKSKLDEYEKKIVEAEKALEDKYE